jgi:tRNA(fMet)-specific endonuclease VapC
MTPYVLDTDTLTLFQENDPVVVQRVLQHPRADLALAVLSVEEQLSGWYTRLRRAKKREELARVYGRMTATLESLARFQILSFTEPGIVRYEQLFALKLQVAKMDLRIAAVVLDCGGTLVTRNQRDFQRIPGLPLVDWSV